MAVSEQAKFIALLLTLTLGGCVASEAEKRKIIIILGPPCAGCGSQSPSIAKAWGIPHLDTGNMLREAGLSGTPAGLIAAKMMKEGVLVTDSIVNQVVNDRMKLPDCAKGFLLDGYPRNAAQAKILDDNLAATGEVVSDVLVLDVPMKGLQQCVMHRWTSNSGFEWTNDYIGFRVPKSLTAGATAQCDPNDLAHCNMWDDWTKEPLLRRADDNLVTLDQRVKIYHDTTDPVIAQYRTQGAVRDVNAYQAFPTVRADIQEALVHGGQQTSLAAESTRYAAVPSPMTAVALAASAAFAVVVAVLSRPRNNDVAAYDMLVE